MPRQMMIQTKKQELLRTLALGSFVPGYIGFVFPFSRCCRASSTPVLHGLAEGHCSKANPPPSPSACLARRNMSRKTFQLQFIIDPERR